MPPARGPVIAEFASRFSERRSLFGAVLLAS